MSVLGDTEIRAIRVCARAIRVLDNIGFMTMTKEDDAAMVTARHRLLSVIESNGYRIEYDTYRLLKASNRN